MELCTSSPANRLIPKLKSNLTPFRNTNNTLQWKPSFPLKPNSLSANNHGFCYYNFTLIKAKASDETSSGANQYLKDEPDVVDYSSLKATTPEESNGTNQYIKEESDSDVTDDEAKAVENSGLGGFSLFNDDAAATDDQFPQFDFLNKLKVELDLQDSFSIALFSAGGVLALWLTVSIVGAIDKIPLFPKLMEVVGLGYSIWFSTRYLLFKRNRDELALKIEEIKEQVLDQRINM